MTQQFGLLTLAAPPLTMNTTLPSSLHVTTEPQRSYWTHDNKEHLAMMERIQGPIPRRMIQRSRKQKYFHCGRLNWNECSKSGRYVKAKCKPLRKYLLSQATEHHQFFNLLERMLEYEPSKRISLSSALRHPFFLPLHHPGKNQLWRNSSDMSR